VVKLSIQPAIGTDEESRLYAQISGSDQASSRFWTRPEPNVIVAGRLAAGLHTVRAVQIQPGGSVWFSEVRSVVCAMGETNELTLSLRPGAQLRGVLDSAVPRPVKNGRVVAHVWPPGSKPQENPPVWHAWAAVREDGSFAIDSLPAGDLEIVGLCDGYVRTNGPGQFSMRYPQTHVLGTNDLEITLGMEPKSPPGGFSDGWQWKAGERRHRDDLAQRSVW
jgi:hypothetical protein